MASGELSAANQAVAAAEAQKQAGIQGIVGGVGGLATAGLGAFGSENFLGSNMGKFLMGGGK